MADLEIGTRVTVTLIGNELFLGRGTYLGLDNNSDPQILLDTGYVLSGSTCVCVPSIAKTDSAPDSYMITTTHPVGLFYVDEHGVLRHKKEELYEPGIALCMYAPRKVEHGGRIHLAFEVSNFPDGMRLVLATCAGFPRWSHKLHDRGK